VTQEDFGAVDEPLVSVIIPVYNRAQLIGRAIGSVLVQTYRNFEIIVVDDASTDDLAGALSRIAPAQLRRVAHPQNRGAAAARNTGVAAAAGEYVAFLDSDDIWYPQKLAAQVVAMRRQPPDIAGTVCAYDCIRTGRPPRCVVPGWTSLNFARSQLLGCTCGPGTTLLCRRAVFSEIGPYDEELRRLEDWDWLLRLVEGGYRLLGSREVLAWVEVGAGGTRRQIDAALRRIRERHEAIIARDGAASRRCFAATLHLEAAAAALAERDYGAAAMAMTRSLALYPMRGAEFYRYLIRRIGWACGFRGAGRSQSRAATSSL
jgi:glycosyltransferase involved in cell wall biosynthesis